jgi:SAM-dependent methyltransferase
MALAQHDSIDIRFQQQVDNARQYLLPFIEQSLSLRAGMQVMEIGCGEGGVLRPFAERGAFCLGVDLSPSRVERATRLMQAEIAQGQARFLAQNVYDSSFREAHQGQFDLILLKDTIEHIPDQETFIPYLKQFLRPEGVVFFGFPPWTMPFGGHQQICRSKVLGYLPYYHLLPKGIYRWVLEKAGEAPHTVQELMEIKDTGISIHRFERILKASNLMSLQRTLFLFNPIYAYKFGLTPRKQAAWLVGWPRIRDFFTTAAWYLVQQENKV